MKLNLRKAAAIQEKILEKINSIDLVASINLNEFQDGDLELDKAEKEFYENADAKIKLWETYYSLRSALGEANVKHGIHLNLTRLSLVEKLIATVKPYASKGYLQVDSAVLKGKLAKLSKSTGEDRYGYQDTVQTGVLKNLSTIQDKLNSFSKLKQEISDEILELNVSNHIDILPETEAVLKLYNIL